MVVAVELKGGKYLCSGLGCPTVDCCHCRRDHWYEVLDSLRHCGIGRAVLTSCHLAHHLRLREQERSNRLHFVFSYPYSGSSVDYRRAWFDGLRQKEAAAPGYGIFLDLVDRLGWSRSQP